MGEPLCVYCRKGTTPKRFVKRWRNWRSGRDFYAHAVCLGKNECKPIPRLRHNDKVKPRDPDEALALWNALVDELESLLAHMRVVPHRISTMQTACDAWNDARSRLACVKWPTSFMQVDDQCRVLRWRIDRFKEAIEKDRGPSKKRGVINFNADKLRVPQTRVELEREWDKRIFSDAYA